MADRKISELTALTGANSADDDVLVIVDTSADETKKITLGELENALAERDFSFGDNDKLVFGAGSDLQIYHDGNNSYIQDEGTGILAITTNGAAIELAKNGYEKMVRAEVDGAVSLYYDASTYTTPKLATTSTGIDVTGTVTADGLTVDGNAKLSAGSPTLRFTETDQTDLHTRMTAGGGSIYIQTENDAETVRKDRFRIQHSTGDISFYEDTGTTAKFFWDASAESLGIGTSSPTGTLSVVDSTSGDTLHLESSDTARITLKDTSTYVQGTGPYIQFQGKDSAGTNRNFGQIWGISDTSNNGELDFKVRSSGSMISAMRIDSSGNVGIGTSSPQAKLDVTGSAAGEHGVFIYNSNASGYTGLRMGGTDRGTNGDHLIYGSFALGLRSKTNAAITFEPSGTERMRIDSSGNLLVGKTSIGTSTDGFEARAGGITGVSDTSGAALYVNRNGSDGDMVIFQKVGTTVGSIGTYGGYISVGSGDVYVLYNSTANALLPASTATAGTSDGAIDLGSSSRRFKDLYLSGGVYEGSSNVGTKVKTGSSSVSFTLSCNPQGSLWRHGYILITCSAGSNASTSADTIYALYDVQADLTNSYPVSLTFKDHIGTSMTDFSISLSSGVLTVADNSATWDNMICRVEFGVFTGNVGIT